MIFPGVGLGKGTNMAFLYLAAPEDLPAVNTLASKKSPTYTWAIAVGVVAALMILAIAGILFVAIKITRMKQRKNRANNMPKTGPESLPMPVNEDEGVVRLDATVSNSDV